MILNLDEPARVQLGLLICNQQQDVAKHLNDLLATVDRHAESTAPLPIVEVEQVLGALATLQQVLTGVVEFK